MNILRVDGSPINRKHRDRSGTGQGARDSQELIHLTKQIGGLRPAVEL